jgi:hypothetical protein
MNDRDPPRPAELCLRRSLERAEDYVRCEPAKAVAAAMGAGLLLKLLPTRAMVRPLATLAVTLLPPVLLGLGLLKAFELCCQQTQLKPELPSPPESP